MKTRLRVALTMQEKNIECMLELPSDLINFDSLGLSEAVTNLFELHPGAEVHSVTQEQTTLHELPRLSAVEMDTSEAQAALRGLMYSSERRRF